MLLSILISIKVTDDDFRRLFDVAGDVIAAEEDIDAFLLEDRWVGEWMGDGDENGV